MRRVRRFAAVPRALRVFWLLVALAAGATLASLPARAAVCTASIDNLVFTGVDAFVTTAITTAGTVTIDCNSVLFANVCAGIGAGSGGAAADGARLLTGPGTPLRYQLYQDAAMSLPWGSLDTPGLGTVPIVSLGSGQRRVTRPIYARLFEGQTITAPGSYTSNFAGATGFYYGEITVGTCNVALLGSVVRPAFQASTNVPANCLIDADAMNFGPHGTLTQPLAATTTLRVRCTPGTTYSIGLGEVGASPARAMRSGADAIEYRLFQDEARSIPWVATGGPSGTGDGAQRQLTVYGSVPPQRTPRAGTYADTVVVTVTY